VRCEQVREQLAEHLLGTLDDAAGAAVGAHLRGCASCRAEMATLAEGVSTFAAAAHDIEPPGELGDRVLSVLQEEWAEAASAAPPPRRGARFRRAAGIAALVAAIAWAAIATVQAGRLDRSADRYEALLAALGGEDVRVGELRAEGSQDLQGAW
jgi:predicted anti-sigma-YlaC factor YlaD